MEIRMLVPKTIADLAEAYYTAKEEYFSFEIPKYKHNFQNLSDDEFETLFAEAKEREKELEEAFNAASEAYFLEEF